MGKRKIRHPTINQKNKMENKIIIGIDLGGTKIMVGAVTISGNIIGEPIKVLTVGSDPSDKIISRITSAVDNLLIQLNFSIHNVIGIGIGSTGPLNIEKGIILECPQLPSMNFFPLKNTFEKHYGVPVYINNDANCLIYAEVMFGVAKNKNNIVGFTLGTGIGCAIILNHKILNGTNGAAGEVWPSPYKSGSIEDFVSGKGVSKIYKKISGKDASSRNILSLAEKGDNDAIDTWREFGKHLAIPVAWSINLLDPEMIVLGGSISKAHTFFMPTLEENVFNKICNEPAKKIKITISELGDYAGFIGATCLVFAENALHEIETINK